MTMMKHLLYIIPLVFFMNTPGKAQNGSGEPPKKASEIAFKDGEWFQFRIHYGIFNASFATLKIDEKQYNGKSVFHAQGYGETTGLAKLFFKVEDRYESYFDKYTGQPYKFIRDINEGGYTKDIEIDFNHNTQKALVNDKKHGVKTTHAVKDNVQDLISAFYYLRNNYEISDITVGQTITLNMFFDKENFKFKMKYMGNETLRTKFGKIDCMKFRPFVQSGRVFKEEESLTLWVSNDKNKIPIRIKADLAVGSLKADLHNFKGLKYPFKIKVKKR